MHLLHVVQTSQCLEAQVSVFRIRAHVSRPLGTTCLSQRDTNNTQQQSILLLAPSFVMVRGAELKVPESQTPGMLSQDLYEDLSFNSETGHDQNLLRLLRNVTQFVPMYAVRAIKEFPLIPTIFCVLPIHRSRL